MLWHTLRHRWRHTGIHTRKRTASPSSVQNVRAGRCTFFFVGERTKTPTKKKVHLPARTFRTEEGDAVLFMVWIPVPSESYLGRLFFTMSRVSFTRGALFARSTPPGTFPDNALYYTPSEPDSLAGTRGAPDGASTPDEAGVSQLHPAKRGRRRRNCCGAVSLIWWVLVS